MRQPVLWHFVHVDRLRQDVDVLLPTPQPPATPLRLSCRPIADGAQPVRQQLGSPDRSGLANKNEKRGLERVVGVSGCAEHSATNRANHRSMPANEFLER